MVGWRRWGEISEKVLGINRRNLEYVFECNPRKRFFLADDKLVAKQRLVAARLPTPETLAVVSHRREFAAAIEEIGRHPGCVVKPAQGRGGGGVLMLVRQGSGWRDAAGTDVTAEDLSFHMASILSGMFSFDHLSDRVLAEPLLEDAAAVKQLHGGCGVADVRLIAHRDRPVMAMLRLPTRTSHGASNLHAGGIGVGVELATGVTTHGIHGGRPAASHPDTGTALAGVSLPHWPQVLEIAGRVNAVFELGYLGVDLVLDAKRGPLVLEVNVRPGLEIQLANLEGLRPRLSPPEGG
jgi:alpha-L-glutamate ligase-like protein